MSARGVPERRLYHKYPLELGEKGRKTGWQPKRSIRRDSDGLDNVLDFFGSSSGEEVAEEMDERGMPVCILYTHFQIYILWIRP